MAAKFQLTDQQRARLGTLFIEHRADLWPHAIRASRPNG